MEVVEIEVQTPFEVTEGSRLSQDVLLVPIMNIGILMTEPFLKVLPAMQAWLYRT
jgi:uracil phosphoribosyltransferase